MSKAIAAVPAASPTKKQPRNNTSFAYLDLAFKIQFPPKHYAARIALWFLAKTANSSGKSYHGYRSISAHTQLGHKAIHHALSFLRGCGILTWEKGEGGNPNGTNHYKLDLSGMRELVRTQGVFDFETGKLKKYGTKESLFPQDRGSDSKNHFPEGVSLFPEDTSFVGSFFPEGHEPLSSGNRNTQVRQHSKSQNQHSSKATSENSRFDLSESSDNSAQQKGQEHRESSGISRPSQPPSEFAALSSAELLDRLGHKRAMALYNRYDGKYGRERLEQEYAAFMAEQAADARAVGV